MAASVSIVRRFVAPGVALGVALGLVVVAAYVAAAEAPAPAGMPTLPFPEIFGHDFSVPANLIVANDQVTAVKGRGSRAFDVTQTAPKTGFLYPAKLEALASGKTTMVGDGLSGYTGPDLSGYADFTQLFLCRLTHAGYTLKPYNILAEYIDKDGVRGPEFLNAWTVDSGVKYRNGEDNVGSRHCIEDKNIHLVIYTRRDGVLSIYVDGVLAAEGTAKLPLRGTGIAYNIDMPNGSMSSIGTHALLAASFFGVGVDAGGVARLDEYYRAAYPADYKPASLLKTELWIYNSNSIGQGYFHGNANVPSAALMATLSTKYRKNVTRWYNLSLGGIDTQRMSKDAPVYVDPFWKMCSGRKNLLLHEGTNDIALHNVTGAQAYANLKTYWKARTAAGCDRVFVATILPRDGFSPAQEDSRIECNNLIRAHAVKDGASGIIDFDTNPRLMNVKDTAYYLDGIHPNPAGVQEMADTMAAAIAPFVK